MFCVIYTLMSKGSWRFVFSFVLSEVTENKGKLNADESKHRSVLVNLDTD